MKLQLKFLLISIVIFSVSFLSDSMQAQGIYSKNKDSQSDSDSSSSPALRAKPGGGDPNTGSGDAGTGGGGIGGNSTGTPVGEAWLFFSFLAGGYAMLQKRNTRKKHEI